MRIWLGLALVLVVFSGLPEPNALPSVALAAGALPFQILLPTTFRDFVQPFEGGTISSADGSATLSIPLGSTTAPGPFALNATTDAPPGAIGQAYALSPANATFVPGATLTLKYDPNMLPASTRVTDLTIGFAANDTWIPFDLSVSQDFSKNTLSAIILQTSTTSPGGPLAAGTVPSGAHASGPLAAATPTPRPPRPPIVGIIVKPPLDISVKPKDIETGLGTFAIQNAAGKLGPYARVGDLITITAHVTGGPAHWICFSPSQFDRGGVGGVQIKFVSVDNVAELVSADPPTFGKPQLNMATWEAPAKAATKCPDMDGTDDGWFGDGTTLKATFKIINPSRYWVPLQVDFGSRLGTGISQTGFVATGPGTFLRSLSTAQADDLQPGQRVDFALDDWDPNGGPITVKFGDASLGTIPPTAAFTGSFTLPQVWPLCSDPLRAYQDGIERELDLKGKATFKVGLADGIVDALGRTLSAGDLLCPDRRLASQQIFGAVSPQYAWVMLGPPPFTQSWTNADLQVLVANEPTGLQGLVTQQVQVDLVGITSASSLQLSRASGGPVTIPMQPVVSVTTLDPASLPGVQTVATGTITSTLSLSGISRAPGSVTVQGDVNLAQGIFFVDGDLIIQGGLRGDGTLAASGNIEIDGPVQLRTDANSVIVTPKTLVLNAPKR